MLGIDEIYSTDYFQAVGTMLRDAWEGQRTETVKGFTISEEFRLFLREIS